MRIPGLKSARQSLRWIRSRFTNHVLILGYHRIADVKKDPYQLCVSPRHFEEHLEVLHNLSNPIHLKELSQSLEKRCLPIRAVVITFDDGYSDNLYIAKPLLERYQIPATVFIATGHMDKTFWWDDLERTIMSPKKLPEQLHLIYDRFQLDLRLSTDVSDMASSKVDEYRAYVFQYIYQKLLPLAFHDRRKVLADLIKWSGIKHSDRPPNRVLNADELTKLVDGGLIDVGSHSVTHALLSNLSIHKQQWELSESKSVLEKILGRKVTNFSYPHGLSSKKIMMLVREAGFVSACASHTDVVRLANERFNLPRFWVKDCNGKKFFRWLKHWVSN